MIWVIIAIVAIIVWWLYGLYKIEKDYFKTQDSINDWYRKEMKKLGKESFNEGYELGKQSMQAEIDQLKIIEGELKTYKKMFENEVQLNRELKDKLNKLEGYQFKSDGKTLDV